MGDVVGFPLRVSNPRLTLVAQRSEASFGSTVPAKTRFGGSMQTPDTRSKTQQPANSRSVALPRKFAETLARDHGIRRLAAVVIL
jgi:hypothetical protein